MYHADLIGGLASKIARRPPVVWGIRHSNLDPRYSKRSTILTMKACARFSRLLPRRIVSNSQTALDLHVALGYDASKMTLIPNGFNLERFRPDPDARPSVRKELGLDSEFESAARKELKILKRELVAIQKNLDERLDKAARAYQAISNHKSEETT